MMWEKHSTKGVGGQWSLAALPPHQSHAEQTRLKPRSIRPWHVAIDVGPGSTREAPRGRRAVSRTPQNPKTCTSTRRRQSRSRCRRLRWPSAPLEIFRVHTGQRSLAAAATGSHHGWRVHVDGLPALLRSSAARAAHRRLAADGRPAAPTFVAPYHGLIDRGLSLGSQAKERRSRARPPTHPILDTIPPHPRPHPPVHP